MEALHAMVVEFINLILTGKLENPPAALTPHNWDPYLFLRSRGVDREVAINRICKSSRLPYYHATTPHPTTQMRTLIRTYAKNYSLRATTPLPWIPLTTIGSVPVLGHFYPKCTDFGGFPQTLCIRVVVGYDFYMANLPGSLQLLETADPDLPPLPEPPLDFKKPSDVLLWLNLHHMLLDAQKFAHVQPEQLDERIQSQHELAFGFHALIQRMNTVPLSTMHIDRDLLNMIPENLASKYNALCFYRLKNVLYVAMADPLLVRRFEEELNARATDMMGGNRSIIACYAPDFIIGSTTNSVRNRANIAITDAPPVTDNSQQNVKVNIDTPKIFAMKELSGKEEPEIIFHYFIQRAVAMHVSDVHFDVYESRFRVRFRIDGSLKTLGLMDIELLGRMAAVVKVSADMDVAERRLPQDGKLNVSVDGRIVQVRVSTLPMREHESVVLRIIDTQTTIASIADLQLAQYQRNLLTEAAERSHGLILITGPTGSGKSSTLYALLKYVNNDSVNILTVEDPIEIELAGARQIQVREDIDLTFEKVLRSALRHDPDIIMIGEIRDQITADIALKASLTGHLVFSTLHTNDSIRAITRLTDMDLEPSHLADSLLLLQAQRLIRVLCPNCKDTYTPTDAKAWQVQKALIAKYRPSIILPQDNAIELFDAFQSEESPVYIPKGCWKCLDTGYLGRKAIMEVCLITDEIKELITRKASYAQLYQVARNNGFRTYYEEGLKQFLIGETSFKEIDSYRTIDPLSML